MVTEWNEANKVKLMMRALTSLTLCDIWQFCASRTVIDVTKLGHT